VFKSSSIGLLSILLISVLNDPANAQVTGSWWDVWNANWDIINKQQMREMYGEQNNGNAQNSGGNSQNSQPSSGNNLTPDQRRCLPLAQKVADDQKELGAMIASGNSTSQRSFLDISKSLGESMNAFAECRLGSKGSKTPTSIPATPSYPTPPSTPATPSYGTSISRLNPEQQKFCESVLGQRKSSPAWSQFYKQGGCVDGSKPHFFSIKGDQSVSLRFINQKNQRVKIFWLDYQGQAKFYRTLEPGEEYIQQTYMTHPWWITDENNRPLGMLLLPDKKIDVAVIK
jgi:hypothetical protein